MKFKEEVTELISTKGRYALRVMIDLAEQEPEKFIPLEEIATRQGISKKYLEIILKSLVQNDFLIGVRGKGGGYKLTRKPEEYTVGEILEVTEGTPAVVSCLQAGAAPCERKNFCKTLSLWEKFNRLTHDFFFGITLKDLVNPS